MKSLYQRTQNRIQLTNGIGRTTFKLNVRVQLDEEETSLVNRYNLRDAIIIDSQQPALIRNALIMGLVIGLLGFLTVFFISLFNMSYRSPISPFMAGVLGGLVFTGLGAFFYYHLRRKTIYFRDLLAGRTFRCRSVVDLVEKEAWMDRVLSYLRQVIETAKHWGDAEVKEVEALPPEEAKKAILPKMRMFAVDMS